MFFLVLEEPKQKRKIEGRYSENRETSRHLFSAKEKFVFLSFVFSFGE
jgi:hypothetical protein